MKRLVLQNAFLDTILAYSILLYCEGFGQPKIGPLTNISTCRECIIFKAEETLAKIYCVTDEVNHANNVMFEIGQNQFTSIKRPMGRFGLDMYEKPADAFHQLNAICTVFGIHQNMSVNASIYIVVNPNGPPHLSANEVQLEGETVNITCTSSSGRPAPLLNFVVGDTVIDINTNVSTTYDNSTGLYKYVSKLHSFKKEWGNKRLSCQQLPEVIGLFYETESNSVYIDYKYPPSGLFIALIDQNILSIYHTANCLMTNSNPVCNIKWESSIDDFKYTLVQNSTIKFNVTDADFGKKIGCSAECPDFENAPTNSTTVIFAKKPKVIIQPSSVLPVQPSTHLTLTCAANGFPNGNITWTLMKTSNSLSSNGKLCFGSSTCTYETITSDVEQEYLCIAKNEHGTDRGSILVTVQQHRDKGEPRQSGRGSFLWILLSGIAVVTLGIIVLVLCVFRKRWCRGNTLYEDVNIHRDDHHTYQGIAVPSSNRPHESDATLSPVLYDDIDENTSSTPQAGANRTASETENRQCLSENSNPYANVSQRIQTGTQMTEMKHYYSNIPESVKRETNA